MHPYRSWACVTARDDRSAGPRVQASTVSGVTDHEPRRVLSLAYVSSDEELTIDSLLLLHCSRNQCVMLGNESIPVCECVISTRSRSRSTRAFVTTYRWPSHLKKTVSTCSCCFYSQQQVRAQTYSRFPLLAGCTCTLNERAFRLSITRPLG